MFALSTERATVIEVDTFFWRRYILHVTSLWIVLWLKGGKGSDFSKIAYPVALRKNARRFREGLHALSGRKTRSHIGSRFWVEVALRKLSSLTTLPINVVDGDSECIQDCHAQRPVSSDDGEEAGSFIR